MQKSRPVDSTARFVNGLLGTVWGVAFALTLVTAGFAGAHGRDHGPFTTRSVSPVQRLAIEQAWGISVEGIRLTAAGHMLDFRYRVLDPEKAKGKGLIHPKMGLLVIEEKSGTELPVPTMAKVGALKQTRSHLYPDRIYSVLFANLNGTVKAEAIVTVMLGELKIEHLMVE